MIDTNLFWHGKMARLFNEHRTPWAGCFLWFLFSALLTGCSQGLLLTRSDHTENAPVVSMVPLCHDMDASTYLALEDTFESMATHLLHGDGVPGGPVPGMTGFVFTETCSFTEDTGDGPCPVGMAHIDAFCIDRWEGHLQNHSPYEVPTHGVAQATAGVIPQAYISGDVAEETCRAAGKRLCTSAEWLRACRGPGETVFPYGDTYLQGACNEGREQHPVMELFGTATDWSSRQMNDARINQLPNTLEATGSWPACMSAEGVFDLHGNLHEWVADAAGTFRGGFYVDAEINGKGCLYLTTAHGRAYHDYSTGFRCCADVK